MNLDEQDINEFRINLLERFMYLQLAVSITPKSNGGIMNKTVKDTMIEIGDFIKESSDVELRNRGPQIYNFIFQICNKFKIFFRPKINQRQIGRDFNELFKNNGNPYSYGIEYGWIDERIEFFNNLWPSDLPYQAKIGIGVHSQSYGVEEEFLLKDAFFFLVMAQETYDNMYKLSNRYKEAGRDIEIDEDYRVFSNYNHTVATYSRLGTQCFYFFTEAFINSIGFDYYLRNKNRLSSNDICTLQGKKKDGRFIPLEHRIQKFQALIREDKKIVINVTDENQRKEPFVTFFNDIKDTRDAASHFTPVKRNIWMRPDDWLNKIKLSVEVCLEVSKQVWSACYPNRDLPEYLLKLDYDKHLEIAKIRVTDISKHD